MATDVNRVVELIRSGDACRIPENPMGKAVLRDESGKDHISLGFVTKREIIRDIGFDADENAAADIVAAMSAVVKLVKDKKVMEAWLLTAKDIEAELSDDGNVDEVNRVAVGIAEMMLKESLKTYSSYYISHK